MSGSHILSAIWSEFRYRHLWKYQMQYWESWKRHLYLGRLSEKSTVRKTNKISSSTNAISLDLPGSSSSLLNHQPSRTACLVPNELCIPRYEERCFDYCKLPGRTNFHFSKFKILFCTHNFQHIQCKTNVLIRYIFYKIRGAWGWRRAYMSPGLKFMRF